MLYRTRVVTSFLRGSDLPSFLINQSDPIPHSGQTRPPAELSREKHQLALVHWALAATEGPPGVGASTVPSLPVTHVSYSAKWHFLFLPFARYSLHSPLPNSPNTKIIPFQADFILLWRLLLAMSPLSRTGFSSTPLVFPNSPGLRKGWRSAKQGDLGP